MIDLPPVFESWNGPTKKCNSQDIERDLPKRLYLCFSLQVRPNILYFFTPQNPDGNLQVHPQGAYQVKIRVDTDNASSVDKTILVDYKGGWNKIFLSEIG